MLSTSIGKLRVIALIEGVSFLIILGITMPLKYVFDVGGPNKVIGMLHGVFFVLYVWAAIQVKVDYNWNWKTFSKTIAASIIPFGTFWADRAIFKKYVD